MRVKIVTIIRIVLGIALLAGVYSETGFYTTLALTFVLIAVELSALSIQALYRRLP